MPELKKYGSFNSRDVAELAREYKSIVTKNPAASIAEKYNALYDLAEKSDNNVSKEELKFLHLISYKEKDSLLLSTVKRGNFNPLNFSVEGEVYGRNAAGSEEPLKGTPFYSLKTPGNKFDQVMDNKNIKIADLKEDITTLVSNKYHELPINKSSRKVSDSEHRNLIGSPEFLIIQAAG